MGFVRALKRFFFKDSLPRTEICIDPAIGDDELLDRLRKGYRIEDVLSYHDDYVPLSDGSYYYNRTICSEKSASVPKMAEKPIEKEPKTNDTGSLRVNLLKEAIQDAKTVKATAFINAKLDERKLGEKIVITDRDTLNRIRNSATPVFDIDDTSYLDKALRQRRVKVYDKIGQ